MVLRKLFNNRNLLFLISILIFTKSIVLVYMFSTGMVFGAGQSDATLYHNVAIGVREFPNAWTTLLRFLNELGIYNRLGVSVFLSFLAVFIIPFIVSHLALVNSSLEKQRVFLYLFIIISMYPNIFLLSTDIFRDVFMLFIFLFGLYIFKGVSTSSNIIIKVFLFILGLFFIYILYKFRPYLGFSFGIALVIGYFYSFKKYSLLLSVSLLLIFLQIAYMTELLEPLVTYREGFRSINHITQGSGLGITFDSLILFIPKFIQSFIYQMFGFYFPNFSSIVVFIFESVPFMVAFFYLIKNREYSNKFVDFLIVFFVVYGIIWVIGNDNLGTASRIRMFNYIVIYIACIVVYQNKELLKFNKLTKV